VIVCCERTVKTTVSDIGRLFTCRLAVGRSLTAVSRTGWTTPHSGPLGTPGGP
jgi:hypothetical protein